MTDAWPERLRCWLNKCFIDVCIALDVGEAVKAEGVAWVELEAVELCDRKRGLILRSELNKRESKRVTCPLESSSDSVSDMRTLCSCPMQNPRPERCFQREQGSPCD